MLEGGSREREEGERESKQPCQRGGERESAGRTVGISIMAKGRQENELARFSHFLGQIQPVNHTLSTTVIHLV